MSRVNACGTMSGDNREVTVGGRGANDSLQAVLNTDNGAGSDCSLTAEVMVTGNTRYAERRSGGDNRRSRFTVILPSAKFATHCDVAIQRGRHDEATDCLSHVTLPGGHTLQYALECISKVKAMESK